MLPSASLQTLPFHGDADLAALRAALDPLAALSLVIRYGSRTIRPGYHVTEVKAAQFSTLDCGRNADSWQETVLQIEDLGPPDETERMKVGKFLSILRAVESAVRLEPSSRVTIEIGRPGEPMQVFDIGALTVAGDEAMLDLAPRAAICKPRHRADAGQAAKGQSCCAPRAESACCTPQIDSACCAP